MTSISKTKTIEYQTMNGGKVETITGEYHITIPMRDFIKLDLSLVRYAYADGTGISRDLWLSDVEDGSVRIYGSDGIVHGVALDDLVYVRFSDFKSEIDQIESKQKRVDALLKQSEGGVQ